MIEGRANSARRSGLAASHLCRTIRCSLCDRHDSPGREKAYENQACMPFIERVQRIDRCIHRIVPALDTGDVRTCASCCGDGEAPKCIALQDRWHSCNTSSSGPF